MCNTCGGKKVQPYATHPSMSDTSALPASDPNSLKYGIQNLTINNYASVNFFGERSDPASGLFYSNQSDIPKTRVERNYADDVPPPPPDYIPPTQLDHVGRVIKVTAYDYTAQVGFRNQFPVPLRSVRLLHLFKKDTQEKVWQNVQPGETTGADLYCGYDSPSLKSDYWQLHITFDDGTTFSNNGWKQCNLTEDDRREKGAHYFDIHDGKFWMNLRSTPCSEPFESNGQGYNSFAFMRIENQLPVNTTVKLGHQHEGKGYHENTFPPLNPNAVSSFWPVFYTSGVGDFSTDYWNLTATLHIPTPINISGSQTQVATNATRNKGCMLRDDDNFKAVSIILRPAGITFNFTKGSGQCVDQWRTRAGYNTMAFINITNKFNDDVAKLTLDHRYSDDGNYQYVYNDIPKGRISSQIQMMEYFTGLTHPGYDYWNIIVELTNGSKWQNKTRNKQCYLQERDARVLTYSVGEDKFHLGQADGCDDGMEKINQANGGTAKKSSQKDQDDDEWNSDM